MARYLLCASIIGVMAMTVASGQDKYGLITVHGYAAEGDTLPGSVTVDLVDLAEALVVDPITPTDIGLGMEDGEDVAPLTWQVAAGADGVAIVSFLPPPGREGALRLRLYPIAQPGTESLPAQGTVEVAQADGAVTVRNEPYEVTHDPGTMGGLPSRIAWRASGKTFDSFALNDRLYTKGVGGFQLHNDPDPDVEVLAEGPLAAVVRVRARYIGEQPTPSNARATYLFHYFAGSPVVRVEATVTQDQPIHWDEAHLMEINFPDESFTQWANSESPGPTDLAADEASHTGSWGALIDGQSVLGLFGRDMVRVYDGRGGYGTYLHGPWISTSDETLETSTHLFIGDAEGALGQLARLAESQTSPIAYELSTSAIEVALAEINEDGSPEAKWAATMAARTGGPGGLAAATMKLATLRDTVRRGGNATEALAGEGGRLHMLAGERLIAGIRSDGAGASLVSIYDSETGREYLRAPQALWLAAFREGADTSIGAGSSTGFGKVTVRRTKDGAHIRWAESSDQRLAGVEVSQWLSIEGSRLSSTLEIENPSDCSLLSVTPLTLELAGLGDARDDDWVLTPKVSGGLFRDPTRSFPGHSGRYPSGWTTFQFGAFYDGDGGIYFACHDPAAWTKEIAMRAEAGGINASMAWHAENATLAGNGFKQEGETVVELFDGDWFDAARIYRAWGEGNAEWWPASVREDTPEWLRDLPLWCIDNGHSKDCVPRIKAFAEYMGVPTAVHWYSWHEIPFDVDYPHYFPVKPGFAEGVAELQAAGVRVMPYINGRLWDTGADDFDDTGSAAAAKRESGENYTEEYGSGAKLAPMCPTTKLWRDTVVGIVTRLCGPEYNVDGVYIDQVAAAAPALCHDAEHGHPLVGGSWWTREGYWPMLERLQAELHEISPDKMITTECTAEPYAHVFDAYLSWNFWYGDQAPVIAALYGGRLQLFGRTSEADEQAVRVKTGQALVWGEQLGWYPPNIADHALNGPFLRRCARVKYLLRDFLNQGRMEHPPMLRGNIPDVTGKWRGGEATYPAIQAGAWSARDGRLAVVFANTLDEPREFTWRLDGKYYRVDGRATVYTEDGAQEGGGPTLRTPGSVEVSLGPCEVVAYVVDEFEEAAP